LPLLLADALMLAGTLIATHGLVQYFGGGDTIVAEGVRRIRGFYGSPNNMALLLGRILPLALAMLLWGRSPLRRTAYALAAAIMAPCLFLTFSRGAWFLGLPAAILFLGAMRQRKAMLIALLVIVAAFLITIPIAGTERITSLLDLSGTSLFRLSLWKSAVAMVRDHPLTGLGLDNFLYYYPQYILPEGLAEPNLSHPHNILLDFWTRLGIGGVLALVWFVAAFFRRGMQLYRRLPEGDQRALVLGLLASMVDFLAHGLVDNAYFVVELALIFALTLGLIQRLRLNEEGKA
jgi:putative inorganic carbon (HCO3(-)) transporter